MQEEVENRTLTLVVSGTKFTGRLLKAAITKYLAHRKEKKLQKQKSRDIKRQLSDFISQTLKMELSEQKTLITHSNQYARFLGYDIRVRRDQKLKPHGNHVSRTLNGSVELCIPFADKIMPFLFGKSVIRQLRDGTIEPIFSMIQNLSNSIMVPIAGVILAIVMTLELIQMITDKNNLHDVDTWMIFKWVFKSAAAILIVSNTWNIVMGVFDAAQSVVTQAAGIIGSDASIDISSVMTDMESRLMDMDLGPLFGLWFQSLFIGITMWALYICIFIVIYGRMIEIYLVTSVAPIPMATMMGKEWGGMGQNYLRSLIALGFQAFLIIVCVAIYAVLVQSIATESDIIMAIWSCVGYTVLLCFTLFKTGSLAKSVFNAH